MQQLITGHSPERAKRGVQLPARSIIRLKGRHMAKQSVTDKWTALTAYLTELQAGVLLSHWRVSVAQDASDVDAWADISVTSQAAFTAEMRISHDFWRQEPDRQREVLIHELLHLNAHQADSVVDNLEKPLGEIAWAVFSPQYEDATERTVDHMAKVLAQFLPLPEFPKA